MDPVMFMCRRASQSASPMSLRIRASLVPQIPAFQATHSHAPSPHARRPHRCGNQPGVLRIGWGGQKQIMFERGGFSSPFSTNLYMHRGGSQAVSMFVVSGSHMFPLMTGIQDCKLRSRIHRKPIGRPLVGQRNSNQRSAKD